MHKKENDTLLSPVKNDKTVVEMTQLSKAEKSYDTRLHEAVFNTDLDEIEELLGEDENLAFSLDKDGRTPLHTVAVTGDDEAIEMTKLLLGVQPNGKVTRTNLLNTKDSKGFTPLQESAFQLLPDLMQALIGYGADPFTTDNHASNCLHFSVEGKGENAQECTRLLLDLDFEGTLINGKNNFELTPVHNAIQKESIENMNTLLNNKHFNIKNAINSKGQTLLHFVCIQCVKPGRGETSTLCEIFKQLLNVGKSQINYKDKIKRTALHLASILRLPKITEILVKEETLNALEADDDKKLALHYAAENGAYLNGHRCVEILIDRKFNDPQKRKDFLFRHEDKYGCTPFMYAAVNCPETTLQKYLTAMPYPHSWLTDTMLNLIYVHCPRALLPLMDLSFYENRTDIQRQQEKVDSINPLGDYDYAKELQKFANLDIDAEKESKSIFADLGPVTGYEDHVKEGQPETKYLRESEWWDYTVQKDVLTHPLVQLFITKKCQKLRTIIYAWILWQLVWFTSFSLLIFTVYRKDINSDVLATMSCIILLAHAMASSLNEIFELFSVGWTYFINITNLIQLAIIGISIVAVSPKLFNDSLTPGHKTSVAIGILLACVIIMRDIGTMHESIGLVVEVLKQVVFQIIKVLACCCALIFGFMMAFVLVFDDEETFTATFPEPILKLMVMMTGEFEYDSIFEPAATQSPGLEKPIEIHRLVKALLFLAFLICLPIAFFNLLTAFALDRVKELRDKAKVRRIVKQLEHIYFIESISARIRLLRVLLQEDWLRSFNVTSVRRQHSGLVFDTVVVENAHRTLDKKAIRGRRVNWQKLLAIFLGTELPTEVRAKMFDLASKNTS